VVELLAKYAEATERYFCRRCGACDAAPSNKNTIFNVMESLMYARGYGALDLAKKIFAQIPEEQRNLMNQHDYSTAETHCPQKLPIAQLVGEAFRELNG
jgi:uncharacterized protein